MSDENPESDEEDEDVFEDALMDDLHEWEEEEEEG